MEYLTKNKKGYGMSWYNTYVTKKEEKKNDLCYNN